MPIIVGRLGTTTDEDVYTLLARQGGVCCDALIARHEPALALPLAELFARHGDDPGCGKRIVAAARLGLEKLASRDEFLVFVIESPGGTHGMSAHGTLALVAAGGHAAVGRAVDRLVAAEYPAVRKKLTQLLTLMGEPAVAPILSALDNNNWEVARNLIAILGEIGSKEAVPELERCLWHADSRIAKEAIRSLAKIGGQQAEAAVIAVLHDSDRPCGPRRSLRSAA